MSATPRQLFAISALVGECQALAASGILNPSQAAALRCLIAHTQSAFTPSNAGGSRSEVKQDA